MDSQENEQQLPGDVLPHDSHRTVLIDKKSLDVRCSLCGQVLITGGLPGTVMAAGKVPCPGTTPSDHEEIMRLMAIRQPTREDIVQLLAIKIRGADRLLGAVGAMRDHGLFVGRDAVANQRTALVQIWEYATGRLWPYPE